MPFPKSTAYPPTATNAAWQKKKSLLDKSVTTKVGPALTAAEQKWRAVNFADLKLPAKWSTAQAAKDALTKATAAYKTVAPARAALKSAITVATTQSANKKLSAGARTALKQIVVALKEADGRLDMMDDIIPALKVDVQITTKEEAKAQQAQQQRLADARKTLSNVKVNLGSTVLFAGGKGKLGSDGTYEITGGDLRGGINLALANLQKKVRVTAKDGLGRDYAEDMTLAGVRGTDTVRLK
jgi:hypothetical protein